MKKIIGAKIREARERAGISQSALGMVAFGYGNAEKNAAQLKIRKIEIGQQDITIAELIKVAEVLKIELKDILGFDLPADAPPPDTGPPQTIPWELRTIIEGLQIQIKELSNTVHKYQGDSERAYGILAGHTDSIKNLNSAIDNINDHVASIKATMIKAAASGDIKRLKVVGGDK